MFGYAVEKETGNITHYWDLPEKPANTDTHEYVQCPSSQKPPLYKPSSPLVYSADTLIAWGMQNLLGDIPDALKGIAISSFIDFANKATEESKANFLAMATSINLLYVAQQIVSKAIELGADLTE